MKSKEYILEQNKKFLKNMGLTIKEATEKEISNGNHELVGIFTTRKLSGGKYDSSKIDY